MLQYMFLSIDTLARKLTRYKTFSFLYIQVLSIDVIVVCLVSKVIIRAL